MSQTRGHQRRGEHRTTLPFLSSYERARVLAVRTSQLAQGSEPLIPVPHDTKYTPDLFRSIAETELSRQQIPMAVVRECPDGVVEIWALSELTDIEKDKDIH